MTNEPARIGTIRPEVVADKIRAIRNLEYPELFEQVAENPRLIELLWFIQGVSMQPGGLAKLAQDMVEQMPGRFSTEAMRAAPAGDYSFKTKKAVWASIPEINKLYPKYESGGRDWTESGEIRCNFMASWDSDIEDLDRDFAEILLKPWTEADFRSVCREAGRAALARYLAALCNEPDKGFRVEPFHRIRDGLWFIDDPIGAIFEMMDRHAAEVSKRLAQTAVTKKVFDALDYAIQERAMVRIEGDSRFGKTEAVRAWCNMRPGRARLVTVPSSNSVADLFRAIAEALGMEVGQGEGAQRLRRRIEYVLQHGRLFLALDEAAFLAPQSYTRTTAPARLNWVRTEIVDRGLGLGLVVTPQTFLPQVNRFVKKTGYVMEQFFGRNHRVVQLPGELSPADTMAVARIHFPELGEDGLAQIADLAEVSENYLQAVEAIAKLARYIARRENHRRVTVADLKAAASEVIPQRIDRQARTARPESTRDGDQTEAGAVEIPGRCGAVARAVKAAGSEPAKPVLLPSRSLRGAGSDKAEAELISADA